MSMRNALLLAYLHSWLFPRI